MQSLPPGAAPDYFAHPEHIASTGRARALKRLEAYYKGTQYDGRPDFFSGENAKGEVVPLRERKPCIVYPLPRACCNQATRFTFGEGRFPTVAVAATRTTREGPDGAPVEQVDAAVPELAVDEEEAATLTAYLSAVVESARLKSTLRTLCRHGLAQRTAVVALAVRRGAFTFDIPRASDCWPEFVDGDPDGEVQRMVWCYSFAKTVQRGNVTLTEQHLFRRDYTAEEVVFYHDAPVRPGQPVVWERDEEKTRRHGLGFCPVRWIRNLPEPTCNDIDGVSLYDDLEDEFDALNLALSQRHRGIIYFGTPQAWEAGVGEDEQPAAMGRTARPVRAAPPAEGRPADPYVKSGGEKARKKAPDEIWSYQNEQVKLGIMETTGKAFEVASAHVLDIRARILEAIDVVLLDPKEAAGRGEVSGAALARLYAPLLALVDELRDCWWTNALAPLLSMILRATTALKGRGIFVAGAGAVAAICSRFFLAHEEGTVWVPPKMVPSWGAYFSPSPGDIAAIVDATVKAKEGRLISAETGTRAVAPYYGVTDIEGEAEEAEGASPAKALGRLEAVERRPPPEAEPPAEPEDEAPASA